MTAFKEKLDLLGTLCGIVGAAACVFAILLRFALGAGNPAGIHVAPRSWLLGGIAAMAFACWLKLSAK